MSKTQKVLEHLKLHKKITSWEAIQLYRATRLSSIIYNLRNRYNMNIRTIERAFKDENGHSSYYAEYILGEE